MSELTIYIKTVIAIILLKPLVLSVLPDAKNGKYINFVLGIMIITLLILPFKKVDLKDDIDYSFNAGNIEYKDINSAAVEKEIERKLNEKFNTDDVDVTIDESLNIKSITSQKKEEIMEYLGL